MSDLADFLLACIAEDEAVARDLLAAEYRPEYRHEGYAATTWSNPDYSEEGVSLSPERMLAECEAKRELILMAQRWIDSGHPTMDWVFRVLAKPYAEHPDFPEEWRP